MHYTGQVYRHPMEGYTPLLEVTIGCSHNKCSFCTMYDTTPFRISPLAHIIEDLQELSRNRGTITRVFLVNADPFVLSTEKLTQIAQLMHQYLPDLETITCYASIQNLMRKSLDDLRQLRALGYNDLHIGLESGYEPAVQLMQKGFTIAQATEQIDKLTQAGMRWDALLMLGVAGKGNSQINVDAVAKLLNQYPPYMVSVMPTSVTPGSRLEALTDAGDYVEQTEREMLEEEILLLQHLNMPDDCYFFGSHNFNLVPVSGLFVHKAQIIKRLQDALYTLGDKTLNSVKPRGHI